MRKVEVGAATGFFRAAGAPIQALGRVGSCACTLPAEEGKQSKAKRGRRAKSRSEGGSREIVGSQAKPREGEEDERLTRHHLMEGGSTAVGGEKALFFGAHQVASTECLWRRRSSESRSCCATNWSPAGGQPKVLSTYICGPGQAGGKGGGSESGEVVTESIAVGSESWSAFRPCTAAAEQFVMRPRGRRVHCKQSSNGVDA